MRRIYSVILIGILFVFVILIYWMSESVAGVKYSDSDFFQYTNPQWMHNAYWFEGKAEINFYQATVVKYGIQRKAREIVHILVTEKHKPDLLVKADNWRQPGLVDMLKFNYVMTIQTGIYTYRQMMSVFFNQADLHIAKMTFGSQEWCGNSFKEIVNFQGRSRFDYNTYWDGQGNGQFRVKFPRDLVLYDALPVQLRMLKFREGLTASIQLLPTQISSKVQQPEIEKAIVHVKGRESITVPAGQFEAFLVIVDHSRGSDRFWFETAFPNRMVKWETYEGNHYQLLSSKKLAYWKLNHPGDEAYLP